MLCFSGPENPEGLSAGDPDPMKREGVAGTARTAVSVVRDELPRSSLKRDDALIGTPCPLCCLPYQAGQSIVTTFCLHILHEDCLLSWVVRKDPKGSRCPVCQTPLLMPVT